MKRIRRRTPRREVPSSRRSSPATRRFGQEAGERVLAGEPLEPTSTATSVRVRNAEITTTDGPFAETMEQLGGFYKLECETREEAVELVAKIPHASMGTIEVRAVPDFS